MRCARALRRAPPPYDGRVDHAEIKLVDGDLVTVEGTLEDVEKKLSDAARSGQSRLAWFTERATEASIGVNPAHVASLRVGTTSD
jgi:hypothetical protein